MGEKSKILIIGGTGYIGKFIVEASAKSGHPTFALIRESTIADPAKTKLIETFKISGVAIVKLGEGYKASGCGYLHSGITQIADQIKIIDAIKEAGNIKILAVGIWKRRGSYPCSGAGEVGMALKVDIRRAVEAAGIPYTYVSSNFFNGYSIATLMQPALPRDKVTILGDGSEYTVFNEESDIGRYTIRAVDDPLKLNKILYIKPSNNIYTFNEVVALWEKKIGKTLQKTYVPEVELLKQIAESPVPINIILGVNHSVFIKGGQTYFEIEPSFGVEASQLYPDINYTTVEKYLDQFV